MQIGSNNCQCKRGDLILNDLKKSLFISDLHLSNVIKFLYNVGHFLWEKFEKQFLFL